MDASLLPALHDVLTVARLRSVGQAAGRLHKTPSAVSQQIRRVESHFGVILFERAGRGLKLTSAGEVMLEPVSKLFDEAGSVYGLLASLSGTAVTTVRIAVSDYLGKALLIPVLQGFVEASLRFEITTTHSPEAVRLVETGDADIGVVTTSRGGSGLRGTELFVQSFFWVAPARRGAPGGIEDRLRTEPLLRLAEGSEGRRILDRLMESYRLTPKSTIDVPSVSMLVSYAAGGVGVGLAPAAGLFDTSPARVTLVPAEIPPLPVRLVTRSGYRPPPAVMKLIEKLEAEGQKAQAHIETLTPRPRNKPR